MEKIFDKGVDIFIDGLSKIGIEEIPFIPPERLKRHDPNYQIPPPRLFPTNSVSKPELAPPGFTPSPKTIGVLICDILDRVQEISGVYLKMLKETMSYTHESISANLEKHLLQEKEIQNATESSDFWDFLRQTAIYLLGATSMVIGATLLRSGSPLLSVLAGSSMIVSGGLSIVGSILCDMKSYPNLAAGLMIAGSGIGLLGGITSAMSGIQTFANVLPRIALAGVNVMASSSHVIRELYEIKICELSATFSNSQCGREISQNQYHTMREESAHFEEMITASTNSCVIALLQEEDAMRKILANTGRA